MSATIVRDNRGRRYTGQQPKGRICESKGCTTVLSIYNHDDICAKCDAAEWKDLTGVDRCL